MYDTSGGGAAGRGAQRGRRLCHGHDAEVHCWTGATLRKMPDQSAGALLARYIMNGGRALG